MSWCYMRHLTRKVHLQQQHSQVYNCFFKTKRINISNKLFAYPRALVGHETSWFTKTPINKIKQNPIIFQKQKASSSFNIFRLH